MNIKALPEKFRYPILRLLKPIRNNPYFDYNDQFKTIFIHIPKTGGTSIYKTLFGKVHRDHISLLYFKSYDLKKFNKYFKFCFVRNPYDRLVSSYFYIKNKNDHYTPLLEDCTTFSDFVIALSDKNKREVFMNIPHFLPQTSFLIVDNNKLELDFIGRFENINHDFNVVSNKLNIDQELIHSNKSKHNYYLDYYDSKLLKIVNEVYADDFRYLPYDKITEK
jgi:hypothetical protein